MVYDMVVVGAGVAGLTAAVYGRRAGRTVLVLEGSAPGGQAATAAEIENWPGTQRISGFHFASDLLDQARQLGADIRMEECLGLTLEGGLRHVAAASGTYQARTVILANGVKRRRLEIPGEEKLTGRGVSWCATCDGAFFKGKDVAVVGGGSAALEDALTLSKLCTVVWLVHRRDAFRGEAALVEKALHTSNIRPLYRTRPVSIQGETAVSALEVDGPEGRRLLPVSGVFEAVGLVPDNRRFSPPVSLDEAGYLKAGEDCKTNVPGVFAAGDARSKQVRQLVTAAADGAAAACAAGSTL